MHSLVIAKIEPHGNMGKKIINGLCLDHYGHISTLDMKFNFNILHIFQILNK